MLEHSDLGKLISMVIEMMLLLKTYLFTIGTPMLIFIMVTTFCSEMLKTDGH